MSVVGYIMGTPARRRAIKAKEAAEREQALASNVMQNAGEDDASVAPNAHSEAPGNPIAPVRKEP